MEGGTVIVHGHRRHRISRNGSSMKIVEVLPHVRRYPNKMTKWQINEQQKLDAEIHLMHEAGKTMDGFSKAFRQRWADKNYDERMKMLAELLVEKEQMQAAEKRMPKLRRVKK